MHTGITSEILISLFSGVGGAGLMRAFTYISSRFESRAESKLDRRLRHIEKALKRTSKVNAVLIRAHQRAVVGQRAGRSADATLADILDAHTWVLGELAGIQEDAAGDG